MEPFQGPDAWIMFMVLGVVMGLGALGAFLKQEIKDWFVKRGFKFGDQDGPDRKV